MANNKHGICSGAKFGMWVLLELVRDPFGHKVGWRCRCDCGTVKIVKNVSTIARGNSTSCGCFRKQFLSDHNCMYDKKLAANVGRKVSVTRQGIEEKDYTGPITSLNRLIRYSAAGKQWTSNILTRADFTCDICSVRGGTLHAHHLLNFSSHPEGRFNLDNGVCLCQEHHRSFHHMYGETNNTPKQYAEFKASYLASKSPTLPKLLIVFGCSGSGKTWLANQLTDRFHVVHYDETPRAHLLEVLHSQPTDKPTLLDLPIKISTFIKRHSSEFDIRCVAVMGDFIRVKQQILGRGGKITPTIYRRWKQIGKRAEKYAEFTGDSEDVLRYLKKLRW